MANRPTPLVAGEIYHCYNRGVDKQTIFKNPHDYNYFLKSLTAYNSPDSAGMLRLTRRCTPVDQPVIVYAYCLLPNHFHLVVSGKTDVAISKLMQRIGTGYTLYFNQKYHRSGRLFQGTFKSKYISSDQDFRQIIGYVGYNYYVHQITQTDSYRAYISPKVGGLTSYFESDLIEIAEIIREKRLAIENISDE